MEVAATTNLAVDSSAAEEGQDGLLITEFGRVSKI
jgi:hypothetical protein